MREGIYHHFSGFDNSISCFESIPLYPVAASAHGGTKCVLILS